MRVTPVDAARRVSPTCGGTSSSCRRPRPLRARSEAFSATCQLCSFVTVTQPDTALCALHHSFPREFASPPRLITELYLVEHAAKKQQLPGKKAHSASRLSPPTFVNVSLPSRA